MIQEFEIDGRYFQLDEEAPYSAVEKLFQRETEAEGLCVLLTMHRNELLALPWPVYRDLAKEVAGRIFPFDAKEA